MPEWGRRLVEQGVQLELWSPRGLVGALGLRCLRQPQRVVVAVRLLVEVRRFLSEDSMAQIGALDTDTSKEVAVPELMAS